MRATVAIFLLLLAGCAGSLNETRTIPAAPDVLTSIGRYRQAYVLAPGDVIEVLVDHMPEVSRTVTVRPDGMVSLPKAGDLHVAGLMPQEAAGLVRRELLRRIIDPEVTITVTNPREEKVFVAGEVGRPGALPLRDVPTAAQALIQAGDIGRSGKLSNVALIRLEPSGYLTAHILQSQARGKAGLLLTLQNVTLQPGDLLIVQETASSQFARVIQDYLNAPLGGLNQVLMPYAQLRVLQEISK
ncbi:polysaccharide biosynthesis/export family protein [Sphingomonas lycopersici]|uniref:Polysaccharide biosynthesis/export family protein n=1 Tax=Sphingomonas lycopersici TaxID=2951807 RepID=A0AA42CP88_9SPHN|nr:polysaccharide biosynthesis/export family protein [Sphingomonas lycopersici]MCW6533477.1 polysaccharide biosynthesis/export family protein [Sphingomonas lycopersici]